MAPVPIQTLLPISTGFGQGLTTPSTVKSCPFPSRMFVFQEMPQPAPMRM